MTDSFALELIDISKKYGAFDALSGVGMQVQHGGRHALIGPNGAGKSTLNGIIAGANPPSSGTVRIFGHDVKHDSEHIRARLGVVRTFQHASLFQHLTVAQAVALAVQRTRVRRFQSWRPVGPAARARINAEVFDCLEKVGLADRADTLGGELSHGESRQLEVAVALGAGPRLLLLDEPTAGMSPAETNGFVELIHSLPPDLTLVIVEHDLDVVFSVATTVTVLAAGRTISHGTPDQIRKDSVVQDVYLGRSGPNALEVP